MNSVLFFVSFTIIVLPYLLWSIPFVKRYIPVVVIQMITGILLGPSLFGIISPSLYNALFPSAVLRQIDTVAQVALIFLGFLIGLHVDTKIIQSDSYKKYLVIGLLSVLVPFFLALPVSYVLYSFIPSLAGALATPITFSLSIALAASVTALPVLGAILVENGLIKSLEGKLAIVFASANDIFLWILLVAIVGITSAQYSSTEFIKNVVLLISFIAVLFALIRPQFEKRFGNIEKKHITNLETAFIVGIVFLCGAFAETIGLQAILGAFLFGLVVPRSLTKKLYKKIETFVLIILVPFFLTSTGLKTSFSAGSSDIWIIFIVITIVSSFGNFVGIALPAYIAGFSKKTSILLGIFMQCKGLMEIVVLSTFLNAKIISPNAFSGMLLMAVLTTSLTQPLTKLYLRKDLA